MPVKGLRVINVSVPLFFANFKITSANLFSMHKVILKKISETHGNVRNVYYKYKNILLLLILALSIVLAVIIYNSLSITFQSSQDLKDFVTGFGVLAPVVVILIMLVELIFVPLPASVIAITNGYTFGIMQGWLYSYIAYIIAAIIAFFLSRKFGQPLIERIVHKEMLEKYDCFLKRKGRYALWFAYIFPFFPNVILSFVIGLSRIRFRNFILYPLIGYIPNLLILNYIGNLLFTFGLDLRLLLLISAIIIILLVFYGIFHAKAKKAAKTCPK
jgi:uncharacterized membrane protein YdjX (TVP38/TMEM64 family)